MIVVSLGAGEVMEGEMGKSGDGFIDRSKVRILLCDNDDRSSEEVFTLLCKCSYQGTTLIYFFILIKVISCLIVFLSS